MPARSPADQIAFRYRTADSATGVTRDTARRLAAHLGVDEAQAIHLALRKLAAKLLPQYEADAGPLTSGQVRQVRKCVPQSGKRSVRSSLIAALLLAGAVFAADPSTAAPYDLVIRNARIVDGTGSPWFRSDVAVRGDTIVAVAPSITGAAKRVIDAKGMVVSPGFIDVHTHAGRTIFQVPTADNYIRQGVTLIMEGADGAGPSMAGSAPTPLKPWLEKLEALPKSINIGSFVGQGAIRAAVVGQENRKVRLLG